MASELKNLSDYANGSIGDVSNKKVTIVVADYYQEITFSLADAAFETLVKEGVKSENITKKLAPGTYELSLAAQYEAQLDDVDAVICIGCVVQGDTKHFDFICEAVAQGLTNVSLKYNKPVIFGVLTPNNYQQALDRAGGKHGNKGVEAAVAALKMLSF